MSDSIDRVFVKAISTVRALSSRSNHGSLPRPPAENRIKLYGLYKQATDGDVEGIMPRPIGFTPEDEGAKKKWDAWKREGGISKTEAKRRYIAYLIDTMRVYASGTVEARELLNELEYLWDQIKDVQVSSDDEMRHHNIPLPSRSPSFIQGDRYSAHTPSIAGRPVDQFRTNLEKIYSHSRRNTMVSLNDYVNRQEPGAVGGSQRLGGGPEAGPGSVYSLPLVDRASRKGLGGNTNISNEVIDDFRAWQGEVNLIINKLTKEFVSSRREGRASNTPEYDEPLDSNEIMKRKIIHILKVIGINALKIIKNFSMSLLAILFVIWCFKRNVVVERTVVTQPGNNNRQKKELVINMVLNTAENKWFIRLLNLINSFVGFV